MYLVARHFQNVARHFRINGKFIARHFQNGARHSKNDARQIFDFSDFSNKFGTFPKMPRDILQMTREKFSLFATFLPKNEVRHFAKMTREKFSFIRK